MIFRNFKLGISTVILLSILFVNCKPSKEINLKQDVHKAKQDCAELYLELGKVPETSKQFIQQNNIKQLFFINGGKIDTKNNCTIDLPSFQKILRRKVKDSLSIGVGVIDIEGKAMKMLLRSDPSAENFKKAEALFLQVYKIAKEMRPNVDWGFYSLPIRAYWNRNKEWQNNNKKLAKILSTTDIIFPSVYDFYEDSNPGTGTKKDSLYVDENVEMALSFGSKYKKPVMPFYWHRWHPSNKKVGMKVIPWTEFETSIQAGLNASFNGSRIKGIVWWGADQYFYDKKHPRLAKELKTDQAFENFQNDLVKTYARNILDLIEASCN